MIDNGRILLAESVARKDVDAICLQFAPFLGDPDVVSVAITLMNGTRLAEQGNPLDDIETHMVFRRAITRNLNDEAVQIGWLHVGITHHWIQQELRSRLLTDIFLAALIFLAIVISSFQSLRMIVMQPLRTLLRAIENWEIDGEHKPIVYSRGDEFGQLIQAFNQMQRRQQYYQGNLRIARDTAESADKSKSAFLAIIGHELRTPLNAVIGFSDLVKQKLKDTDQGEIGPFVDHIRDGGQTLLNMVNAILEITHAQAGRLELGEEPVSLNSLVDQDSAQCLDMAEGDTAPIGNKIPRDLPELRTDPVRLGRVFYHLISNAIRFTPPEGEVRVEAAIGEDGVCIQIMDTGRGMPEDRLRDLQQPFARLETDWTHHTEGAGLGLTYVQQITGCLGGAFVLESTLGKGTIARIQLPASVLPQNSSVAARG